MSAGEVRLWGLIVVGVAFWANLLRTTADGAAISMTDAVLANGAFDVVAWVMLFGLALKAPDEQQAPDEQPARGWLVAAVLILGVIVLVPFRLAAAVAMAALAAMFLATGRTCARERGIAFLLLALAAETVWLSPLLGALHVAVAGLDAQVCAAVLRLLGAIAVAHGNVVENVSAGVQIVIWPYCTSSLPLAGVALAFVVILLYRGRTPGTPVLGWLGLGFAASIVLTETRLVLLATSADGFAWWHDGFGATLYTLAALGLAALFPVMATADAGAAPATRAEPTRA